MLIGNTIIGLAKLTRLLRKAKQEEAAHLEKHHADAFLLHEILSKQPVTRLKKRVKIDLRGEKSARDSFIAIYMDTVLDNLKAANNNSENNPKRPQPAKSHTANHEQHGFAERISHQQNITHGV